MMLLVSIKKHWLITKSEGGLAKSEGGLTIMHFGEDDFLEKSSNPSQVFLSDKKCSLFERL